MSPLKGCRLAGSLGLGLLLDQADQDVVEVERALHEALQVAHAAGVLRKDGAAFSSGGERVAASALRSHGCEFGRVEQRQSQA